ncbi:MAG: sulfatase [Puniceicoccaceae bacterium]
MKNFTPFPSLILLGFVLAMLPLSASRPNILFCISDDQSWEHASAYGYKAIHTPSFDRVAAEGILFNNAFSPSPGCSPTRASMLTGRHIWQIENAGTHASSFPMKYITYPDLLEQNGYFVGATGKMWSPGNYEASGRTRNPAGPNFSKYKLDPPYKGIRDTDYARNFEYFLEQRPEGQPFCFWFGTSEPHRVFEKGSGLKAGKKLEDVVVPTFLPDTPEIRSDILDYCVEIEWFDSHLGRIIQKLEEIDELDNTLIIVTSDNGMAFPRAKANLYEYGFHMPLAIRWGNEVKGGRVVDDVVCFVDLTATIVEASGVKHPGGKYPLSGNSIMNILKSSKEGIVDPSREYIVAGRERHSSSRFNSLAYPQRALRTQDYLYIRNFKPERWPAGAPQKYDPVPKRPRFKGVEAVSYQPAEPLEDVPLGPEHGGYHDIDACPSLTFLIENRDDPEIRPYFDLAVAKRPAEELYDIKKDPGCLNNLAENPDFADIKEELWNKLAVELRTTGDPRIYDSDIFETYQRYSSLRYFPVPDWAKEGKVPTPNWAN